MAGQNQIIKPVPAGQKPFGSKNGKAAPKEKSFALKPKESELLHFLAANRGRAINRLTILEYLWNNIAATSGNSLDVHIARLRRKLEKSGSGASIITIHGFGYMMKN